MSTRPSPTAEHVHGSDCDHDHSHVHGPDCDHDHVHSPARNPLRDVGRNDPCPCGSGRKFKKCHGASA